MLEKYYSGANGIIMIHVGHYPPVALAFSLCIIFLHYPCPPNCQKKNDKQNTAGLILAPTVVFSTVLVEKSIVVQVEHQPPGCFANPIVVSGKITFS